MDVLPDVRYAARQLRRDRGPTYVILLTLALGIGANTAVFSVIDDVLLRPLPFESGERLAFLPRVGDSEADMSIPDGRDLREQMSAFDGLALFVPGRGFDLIGEGDPRRVGAALVEPELFDLLAIQPVAGRNLTSADNVVGGERVVVISEGLWSTGFGADPDIVGRTITLSDRSYTVVGVVPPQTDFLEVGTDVWVPVAVETPWVLEARGTNYFEAIARLRPGVTFEQATNELLAVTDRLAIDFPATNRNKRLHAVPLRDFLVGQARSALLVLFGAVAVVLLIACVNVANLLQVRAARRARESGIRIALGGGRGRIFRLMMTESVVLAVLGGALGVVLAIWATDLLVRLAPADLPRSTSIGFDLRVGVFGFVLSLVVGVAFGLVPAFQAARIEAGRLLGDSGSRASPARNRQRFLDSFVVAEVTLAFILLVAAALLLRSFLALRQVEPGFRPDGVVATNIVLRGSRYETIEDQDRAFAGMIDRMKALPGIEGAALVIGAPLSNFGAIGNNLILGDRPPPEPGEQPSARNRPVLGDYFRVMGIPILSGRGFAASDDARAPPVAVVNESFARRFWPDENPVGKRIAWDIAGQEPRWMTVVGVAADVRTNSLSAPDERTVYTAYPQRDLDWQSFGTLVAWSPAGTAGLTRSLREAIWSVDPAVPVEAVTTMEAAIRRSTAGERFGALAVGLFGSLALMIAVQGIYGVISYVVAQRRGEIGIRMALGASPRGLIRMVLGRGTRLASFGLLFGLPLALAVARLLSGLLFGVSAGDVVSYVAVLFVVMATAVAASYLPARRAAAIDPLEALRSE